MTRSSSDEKFIVGIHINDGATAASTKRIEERFYYLLKIRFRVSFVKEMTMFLGFQIKQDTEKRVTVIKQKNYIRGAMAPHHSDQCNLNGSIVQDKP